MILGSPVRDRLAALLPAFREVGGASSVADAMEHARTLPAAYVLPVAQTATRGARIGGDLRQRVESTIAVLCGVDLRGPDAQDDIEAWRDAIKGALVGWRPSAAHDLVQFEQYDLLSIEPQAAWLQLRFVTAADEYTGTGSG